MIKNTALISDVCPSPDITRDMRDIVRPPVRSQDFGKPLP